MSTSSTTGERIDRRLVVLGAVIAVGTFSAALDATIVSVALNGMSEQFNAPVATIQWVIAGYLLGIATVIPVTGWAVDRFGAKTMWLTTLGVFVSASLLCGLAWSAGSLIAFRVLQGFGAGMIVPIAQILLAREAGPTRVARLMAMVTIPTQLAAVFGPTIGGLLVDTAGWRWIFYLNLPICLTAGALAWRLLQADAGQAERRLDVVGLLLLSPGLALLVFGLSQVAHSAGAAGVLVPLAAGLVLLATFTVHALRTRAVSPLVDVRLFTTRWFRVLAALMVVGGAILYGALFLFPLYFQQARGHTALQAGIEMAPHGIGMVLMLFFGGALADRFGPRPAMLIGLTAMAAGTAVYTQLPADPPPALLWGALVVRGMGLGLAVTPLMAAVYQGGLPKDAIPRASALVNILQRVGGSLGAALFAVVLQHQVGREPPAAFATAFWWVTGVTVAVLLLSSLLPRRAVADKATPAQPAQETESMGARR
jgi:EmrB/QacA subfamily drug resistance transporter